MNAIQTLTELMGKATPGTWHRCRPEAIASDYNGPLLGHPEPVNGPFVASCDTFADDGRMKEQGEATAQYIIAMHSAMPALLALANACQELGVADIDGMGSTYRKIARALHPLTAEPTAEEGKMT